MKKNLSNISKKIGRIIKLDGSKSMINKKI